MFIVTLLVGAVLGLIPATIASRKGRSFGRWWLYGTFFFLIALIHSLVIRSDEARTETGRMCPSCGKRVDALATFCRHCGVELPKLGTLG